MNYKQLPGKIWLLSTGVFRRLLRMLIKPLFYKCGSNVRFNPYDQFLYDSITFGDDIFVGKGACFFVSKGLTVGNKVMFGPNVTIRGGNHNTSVLGKYMADVKIKRQEDDAPVEIEDDVWVGTGVIILKGVTIGRGAIIAAGAVVNRNVEPYSIVGGVPAKHICFRWTADLISKHENILYLKKR
ncbi:MAG TPA: acyltransferase [Ignavibacteria bacterium]|nr:acyltransferase [Ignavibacteria bacterium]